MSTFRDPPRLMDCSDTPDALRSGLDEASRDVLDAAAVERISAAVCSGPGAAGGGGTSSSGAASSGGLSAAGVKILAGAASIGILAGGLWLAAGPGQGGSNTEGAPVMTLPATAPVAPPEASQPPEQQAAKPLPSAPERTDRVQRLAPRPAVAPPSPKSSSSTLAEEHRLLRAARGALSSDPAHALALTREHERRFPRGVLAQEREVIAIQALAALGKAEAARQKADGFDDQYPDSPHRRRVDEVTRSDKKTTPDP